MAAISDSTARVLGAVFMGAGAALALGALAFGLITHGDDAAVQPSASPSPSDASASPSASPSPSASVDPASFVTADGADLMLDGSQFRYAGSNDYTLMFSAPAGVDVSMQTAQDAHFTVMRTWAFFDTGTTDGDLGVEPNTRGIYFQYWDPTTGAPAYNDGESGLEHLDYVLASARAHGIKLILPLVNNWTAFGGVDQYVRWAGGQYHDDFFTNEQIKQWYKDWVSHLVNRVNTITGIAYKDDPTIMAWELGNELRCSDAGPYPSSSECGSDMMVTWADEMSTFLKEQDPNHLIGFGGEGFLCTDPSSTDWLMNCSQSADPVALLALPNIDIHGIHVYPYHWQPTEPTSDWQDWGAWWIDTQGKIAADANKPYYIGEYGWTDQSTRMLVFDDWLQHFYDAGGDGSHFWIMQPASSIGAPPDSVGFTQKCPGPACELVGNWSLHVGQGVDWSEFAPIAESDFGTAAADGTATIDVLANDKVYPPATWNSTSIDLDPQTAGVQTTMTTDRGTFTAVDGHVEFAATGTQTGTARVDYVVSDSEGRTSGAATIAVVPAD